MCSAAYVGFAVYDSGAHRSLLLVPEYFSHTKGTDKKPVKFATNVCLLQRPKYKTTF